MKSSSARRSSQALLLTAQAASEFNCKETDPKVEKACLPLFMANCGSDPLCSPQAHILYSECRTRCGADICSNTTERMGLFKQCEDAWRKGYTKCGPIENAGCHQANENVLGACNAKAGPNCKPKTAACTGDKVSDGKGGCVLCPKGQSPNAEKTKCVPKPPICEPGQAPNKTGVCWPTCGEKLYDPNPAKKLCCDRGTISKINILGTCGNDQQAKDKKLAEIRKKIAKIIQGYAAQQSTNWAYEKAKDNFLKGTYKCNLFVANALREGGAIVPNIQGVKKKIYPPTAGDWGNPDLKIVGWAVTKDCIPGDVVAIPKLLSLGEYLKQFLGRRLGYTGHVAIVAEKGLTVSHSSTAGYVRQSGWGFMSGQHPTCRRYTGEGL
jgi:hypothetical protein